MRLLLSVLLLATTSGCFFNRSTVNPALSSEQIAQLEPGTSTAADVTRILGAPMRVVQLGRRSAYLYFHTHEKQAALFLIVISLRGVDSNQDRCWVFFDENDVLTHVGTTLEANETEYSIPPF